MAKRKAQGVEQETLDRRDVLNRLDIYDKENAFLSCSSLHGDTLICTNLSGNVLVMLWQLIATRFSFSQQPGTRSY